MSTEEKCGQLNKLAEPLGYLYIYSQDIFSSCIDAWQRAFGYCALYDRAASHLGMVFDSLPIYFDYMGKTWLIEFWKGQYGINTGCETGVYQADHILSKAELDSTLFRSVDDRNMPQLSVKLFRRGENIAGLCERHWWLTAFKPGCFSNPSELSMRICISFYSPDMARAFAGGLIAAGYEQCDINLCRSNVCFTFDGQTRHGNIFKRLRIRLVQCINHFGCRIYLLITKPFRPSMDRILYLYYFLPSALFKHRFLRLSGMYRGVKKRR